MRMSKMTITHYILRTLTILLVFPSIVQQSAGQQTKAECQQKCYQSYRQNYSRFCRWPQYCAYTNFFAQVYLACYRQCNLSTAAPTTIRTTAAPTQPPFTQSPQNLCGISQVGRIVGGTQAMECEFPWAVIVNVGTSFCGGSIIDSNTVLTAGHCVYQSSGGTASASTVTVRYGSSDQQRTKTAYVTRVLLNPGFILQYYDYDVALLTLDRNLVFDQCTRPICLPDANANPPQTCTAAGWGALQYTNPSSQRNLRKVSLPIVPLSQCQAAFRNTRLISAIKICAGDIQNGGKDACLGDSGGPLMCYNGGRYYLFGVVSFGRGCATPGYPGVYARVASPAINNWIKQNMND